MKSLVTAILTAAVLMTPHGAGYVKECTDVIKTVDQATLDREGWNMQECLLAFLY